MPEALHRSIDSWTKPYNRPLILNHNEYDGTVIGRIKAVEMAYKNTRSNTPALVFTVNISDKDAIEQVNDGRLQTVSIGVMATDIRCSICGQNFVESGFCEHDKGEVYEGKTCFWDIYEMEAKELSYVIVPSDVYACHIDDPQDTKPFGNNENFNSKGAKRPSMYKNENITLEEAQEEIERLEKANRKLKTSKTEMEESLEDAEEKLKKLEKKVEALEADLETEKNKFSAKEMEFEAEKETKERAEASLIASQESFKEHLVELYSDFRKLTGKKAVPIEEAKEKSTETLKELITDMKEELSAKIPDPINDPGLKCKTGFTENKKEDLDLEKGLEDIFAYSILKR